MNMIRLRIFLGVILVVGGLAGFVYFFYTSGGTFGSNDCSPALDAVAYTNCVDRYAWHPTTEEGNRAIGSLVVAAFGVWFLWGTMVRHHNQEQWRRLHRR